MKNIKISLWLLVMALFAASCEQEDGALYENPDGKVMVSLASGRYIAELIPNDGTQITVQINRNSTKGAFDAPFSFKSSSTLFTMSDTVAHFADGESITHLVISYPGSAQMGIGTTYTLTVSAKADLLSPGGVSTQTLTLNRRLTWVDVGIGQWKEGLIVPLFGAPAITYDVAVQRAEEAEGVYRMVNPYKYEVYPYTGADEVLRDPCYVLVNAADPDKVTIPEAGLGIDWGYGEIFVRTLTYGTRTGKTITFPARSLAVGMRDYQDGAVFYAEECVLIVP
ncbi:hypothetical protein AGMMS50239_17530 [Bacteroidia bacterium]|nr:hypothetical protein AGMMS50239_17530 [Bacteroidia bacterium]